MLNSSRLKNKHRFINMEVDITPLPKLYRYSEKKWLERSLKLGEFRLRPASDYKLQELDSARHDNELVRINKSPASSVTIIDYLSGKAIKPIGEVVYTSEVGTNYLIICFSKCWDERLFDEFPNTDSCLVINDVEEFYNRLYLATESALPQWSGFDAAVIYGGFSKMGFVFSKPIQFSSQHEWRFAWLPPIATESLDPVTITIGSIADIAEIVYMSK